ncbi:helix-turn-helix transcriptional regulator [Bacillus safensis]|uniref:helix-turn-helix domain-containing protein n=1 Tax=Bacillus safensis TaxID=561879 RepID=UPI001D188BDA|nr:helix-turn-helix transcriptional regulator [Bacillus safensis]MBW4850904.1 helix-turn-helix domain-containing protein [Bacillaceae bacterium]MBW4851805.1 helix-turn-helix domain-containing protein [Bacillaceae bacterium]MBW4855892.1 helix-turn-helix domain-containing protein [Bacillaceae bacterium]
MTVFDIVKELCNERKISINELEKSLGYSKNTLYRLKTQIPGADKLQKIADYFDVSTDYLLGRTDVKRSFDLTEKDERDIQKELQKIINGLEGNSYAAFDGQTLDDMDEEDKELLIASLENTLRIAKKIAKQKYTPKKYR